MKTDNRGFTLVELIVCIVILSIVLLAAFGFMVSGAKSYANIDTRITRQLKSQLTLNQAGDCLMNCNLGLATANDGKNVYILNKDSAGAYTVQAFKLDSDNNVQYGSASATAKTTDGVTTYSAAITSWSKVTGKTDSFAVALSPTSGNVRQATVSIKFNGSDITYTKTVALRNVPQRITISVS